MFWKLAWLFQGSGNNATSETGNATTVVAGSTTTTTAPTVLNSSENKAIPIPNTRQVTTKRWLWYIDETYLQNCCRTIRWWYGCSKMFVVYCTSGRKSSWRLRASRAERRSTASLRRSQRSHQFLCKCYQRNHKPKIKNCTKKFTCTCTWELLRRLLTINNL